MSNAAARPTVPEAAAAGPLLVVVSGPSGAGKDSVLAVLKSRGLPLHFTVTATTRPQREVRPEDYQFLMFLSEEEFERLIVEDGLLEHAQVYGHRYGVPKAPVREALERGQDVIMRVDVQGAASVRRLCPEAVLVFLTPPTYEELEERIRARGLDDEAVVQRRLDKAAHELEQRAQFDYIVLNERDRVDAAADRVAAIIAAERCRTGRKPVVIE